MSAAVAVGVALLGGLGSVLRLLLDRTISERAGRTFPYGTLAVNLSGSVALGALAGAAVRGDAYWLWGVGLLGGYTTFSTWMLESHRLAEEGRGGFAALNFVVSVVAGVLAVWAGRALAG